MPGIYAVVVAVVSFLAIYDAQVGKAAELSIVRANATSNLTPASPGHPIGPRCNFRLMGDLQTGDVSKLRTIVERLRGGKHDAYYFCLDSGGGSFVEGLNMARLLLEERDFTIGTVIEEGQKCLSACSLVFMAGYTRGRNSRARYLHVDGQLGLRAPFLDGLPEGTFDRNTVINAFVAAQKGVDELMEIFGAPSGGPTSDNSTSVRLSLFQFMLSHGADKMFLIDTVDKAGRWDIQLFGFQHPENNSQVDFNAMATSCWNMHWWARDQYAKGRLRKRPSSSTQIELDLGGQGKQLKHAISLDDVGERYCVLVGSLNTAGPPWYRLGSMLTMYIRGNQFGSSTNTSHWADAWTTFSPETPLSEIPRHRPR